MQRAATIAEQAVRHAGTQPSHPALIRGAEVWTYEHLAQAVGQITVRLRTADLSRNPVALVMANHPRCVAGLLALEICGHPVILLPGTAPADEIGQLYASSLAQALLDPLNLLALDSDQPALQRTYQPNRRLRLPNTSDPYMLQLTSGSTGQSRFALRRREGVLDEIEAVADRLALESQDRVFCGSSIAHSYGLIGGLLAPLTRGASVIFSFDPESLAEDLTATSPTVVFGLASTYQHVMEKSAARSALTEARYLLSAGAPLPPGLFDAFLRFSGRPIRQDYGTTETGTIAIDTGNPPDPDSVGRALPHLETRLAPLLDDTQLSQRLGEIQLRARAVTTHYLQAGEFRSAVDEDGWFHTRDIGSLTGDVLQVHSRLRDPLVVDGRRMAPDVVERAVARIPGVRAVVALGTTDGVRVVTEADGLDTDTIRQRLSDELHLEPSGVTVEVVASLPRSPAGKILQKYLL